MWFEINGQDLTAYVQHDQSTGSASTSDPLPTYSLQVDDPGSQIALSFGMPITVWDETIPTTRMAQPTRNFLVNELLYSPTSGGPPNAWAFSGPLTSVFSFQIDSASYGMQATYSNTTYSGGNNYGLIVQTCGNANGTIFGGIVAGQTYMASATMLGSGTISNIAAIIQMQYYDGYGNATGSLIRTIVTPTLSAQKIFCSGVAPAGAVSVQVGIGAQATVSGSNSGSINFGPVSHTQVYSVCLEPVLFPGQSLSDGTPIVYPSPDCSTPQVDCVLLPDQTVTRARMRFNGYLKDIKVTYDGTNRTYVLDCASLGDVIDNGAIVNQSFENTTDQNIITTVVSTYFSGVLSAGAEGGLGAQNVVQFGQAISSVTYGDCSFRDVLNSITDATGFIFFVDPYNYVHYNDTPWDYATFTVNVNNPDYVTSFPPQNYQVEYDGSQLRNSVKVLGGQFQTIETDVFSGDGVTKNFTLASQPSGMSNITIGGSTYAPTSANKIGVKGQDTLGSGGIVVLYDRNTSAINFNSAPASGTNNLLVTYPTYRNVSILVEDNKSVATYNGRRFTAKVTDTTIADNTTAQTRGLAEIGKYSLPLIVVTFDLVNQFADRGTTILLYSQQDGFNPLAAVIQQVDMKSQGGGVNIYSYTCGVYRPNFLDDMRNTKKALQDNTASSGSTTIQETIEALSDTLTYSEALSQSTGTPATAIYGASWNDVTKLSAPLRWYRLNEASGTTAHDSGSGAQNGTITGGVTLGQTGLIASSPDTSMLFNGSTGYVSLPTTGLPTGAAAWSMVAWVKTPATLPGSGIPAIMMFGTQSGAEAAYLVYSPASGKWQITDFTTNVCTSASTVTASTVYFLCATYDGTTARLTINNAAAVSAAHTFGIVAGIAAIGSDTTSGDYWTGLIQSAAFYHVALSAGAISTLYTTGVSTAVGALYGFASYN